MSTNAVDRLFGRVREGVLELLLTNPDESFYLREIVRRSGCGHGAVQRELDQLSAAGVLTRQRDGRQVYFQADRRCPIFRELQNIMFKTAGMAAQLRLALAAAARVGFAFIYGSFARGEQRPESDIDLMVIGDARLIDIVAATRALRDRFGRELNPSVFSEEEFHRKLQAGNHFLATVMREPKVMLIGEEHELTAMAGQRLGRAAQEQSGRNRRSFRTGRPRSGRLPGRAAQR